KLIIVLYRMDLNFYFFFTDTSTTEIYTLSLHDALPISLRAKRNRFKDSRQRRIMARRSGIASPFRPIGKTRTCRVIAAHIFERPDRKSTRLNSSHVEISYAVFCLKKKKREHRVGLNRS